MKGSPLVGSCDCNNKPLLFINAIEFLDQLRYNQCESISEMTDICIVFVFST